MTWDYQSHSPGRIRDRDIIFLTINNNIMEQLRIYKM